MIRPALRRLLSLGVLTGLGLALTAQQPPAPPAAAYTPAWDSLGHHEPAPEWFRDGKFGIYFHWGVYSVAAFANEWYPRNLYQKGSAEYQHHVATYGAPATVGYPDLVPRFTADRFDADAWAALFAAAGATFAGPVAEHHDGFAMWASKVTPWNAKDRGPKRDLVGELASAIRKRNLRFVTTFHHDFNNLYEIAPGRWTGFYEFVKRDFPALLDDPERALLYGYLPRDQFVETVWKAKLFEVIDAYQPDMIWHDSWLDQIPEKARQEYVAYYFNRAREWGREVMITCKQLDLPREVAVEDFEKGRTDTLTEYTWLTDDTISRGSWCYTQDLAIKPAAEVLHVLIDIVSKNGQLLLNISPKADGTIPEDQQEVLQAVGRWLRVNGEAIYNTRPWLIEGEGPTRLGKGGHFVKALSYTAQDIRYTRSKDGRTLYATVLGWPTGALALSAVRVLGAAADARVALLGRAEPVPHRVNEAGQLVLEVPPLPPEQRPCDHAFAFRLSGFDLGLHPEAQPGGATELLPERALLEGERIQVETKYGQSNIGFWDDPAERVHWLLRIAQAGTYRLRGDLAAASGDTRLAVEVAGQTLEAAVPKTADWGTFTTVDLGPVTFAQPGVFHLVLRPVDAKAWRAVNVQRLRVARTGP